MEQEKKKPKAPTSFRFSQQAHELLDALAVDTGLSQTALIEMAIRDLAKQRGVKLPEGK